MKLHRLFIAIDLPQLLKERLSQVQKILSNTGADVKWVEEENFHLTLKFLGETPATKISSITQVIQEAGNLFSPFNLKLEGIGTFPARGRPRVIWAGVGGKTDSLISIQTFLEQQLAKLGFPLEKRRYSPHLTVGRPREYGDLGNLSMAIDDYTKENFGEWQVNYLNLMESTLTKSGPIYTIVDSTSLKDSQGSNDGN